MPDTTVTPGTPARNPILPLRLAMLAVCVVLLASTTADPDLWGHVKFGGDIVAAGSVPRVDPYSFTSDRPWVNHEWLAEVFMFGAYRAGGNAGLVALKLALDLALIALAARQLREIRSVMARDGFVVVLVFGMLSRALAVRPQLFSLVLFGLLLTLLAAAARGRWRALGVVPLVMAAWVNFHGGWLVGLGVFGLWLGLTALSPRMTWRQRGMLAAAGLAAVGATLVNPYGSGLWSFLHETVGLGRADIADWQPIYRLPIAAIASWLFVVASAVVLGIKLWRQQGIAGLLRERTSLAIIATLAVLSFRVSRLDVFLAIAVVMLLAPKVALAPGPVEKRARSRASTRRTAPDPGVGPVLVLTAGVLVAPLSMAVQQHAMSVRVVDNEMPEAAAVAFVQANHLRGRMVVWYDWGEYAIWHLSPDIRVSIDGRRETAYSDRVNAANYAFFFGGDGPSIRYPERVNADYIWCPNKLAVARALPARGWVPLFTGPVSTIFGRTSGPRRVEAERPPTTRPFPGP